MEDKAYIVCVTAVPMVVTSIIFSNGPLISSLYPRLNTKQEISTSDNSGTLHTNYG